MNDILFLKRLSERAGQAEQPEVSPDLSDAVWERINSALEAAPVPLNLRPIACACAIAAGVMVMVSINLLTDLALQSAWTPTIWTGY